MRRLPLSSKWRAFCEQLWENGSKAHFGRALWHSIWVHLHAGQGNAIFASVHEPEQIETALWEQVYGDELYIIDEPLAGEQGARMVFPPFAFQQANLGAFRALIQEVGTWCGNLMPDKTISMEDASQLAAHAFERTTTGALPKVVATRMDSSNEIRIAEFCAGVGAIGQSVVCQLRKQPSRFRNDSSLGQ
ncbi:hypothetical protein F1559_002206 [Cyanidiococcus yangmingshanensis]|uniref:Uncharacterized protein n=1 Tax=Cyanidiococcus yangmingshanensis TaxID=2690220 RepID=A0A7J7IGA4_9RHOD|nr:hypothetical protein F1559_002206 [Cyanidiococcus yangmingshanensis]